MLALTLKEIKSFLNTLSAYLVIGIYLLINGIILWIMPGSLNIMDGSYAGLDNLFIISPWVFMFLIPAITMKMFADERKAGTMEFLLTRPLTDLQIIMAKFLAGLVLIIFSILPTLIYFYSVYQLGNPIGNIDVGATVGSFIGLLFLGAAYLSIGLFSSSLTDNSIIAFIISVSLSFLIYFGFEQLSSLELLGQLDLLIINFGIYEHYLSISRGVVDSRDLLYFISLIGIFILLTQLVLKSRKWS